MRNLKAIKFDNTPESLARISDLINTTNSTIEKVDRSNSKNPCIVIKDSDGRTFELRKNHYLVKYVNVFPCDGEEFEENTDFLMEDEYMLTGSIKPDIPKSKLVKLMAHLTSVSFLLGAYILGALGMGVLLLAINWALKFIFNLDIAIMSSETAFIVGFVGCFIIRAIEKVMDHVEFFRSEDNENAD